MRRSASGWRARPSNSTSRRRPTLADGRLVGAGAHARGRVAGRTARRGYDAVVDRLGSSLADLLIAVATALGILALVIPLFLNPVWVGFEQGRAEAAGVDRVQRGRPAHRDRRDPGRPRRRTARLRRRWSAGAAVLNERERSHMRDVRGVFIAFFALAIGLVVAARHRRRSVADGDGRAASVARRPQRCGWPDRRAPPRRRHRARRLRRPVRDLPPAVLRGRQLHVRSGDRATGPALPVPVLAGDRDRRRRRGDRRRHRRGGRRPGPGRPPRGTSRAGRRPQRPRGSPPDERGADRPAVRLRDPDPRLVGDHPGGHRRRRSSARSATMAPTTEPRRPLAHRRRRRRRVPAVGPGPRARTRHGRATGGRRGPDGRSSTSSGARPRRPSRPARRATRSSRRWPVRSSASASVRSSSRSRSSPRVPAVATRAGHRRHLPRRRRAQPRARRR